MRASSHLSKHRFLRKESNGVLHQRNDHSRRNCACPWNPRKYYLGHPYILQWTPLVSLESLDSTLLNRIKQVVWIGNKWVFIVLHICVDFFLRVRWKYFAFGWIQTRCCCEFYDPNCRYIIPNILNRNFHSSLEPSSKMQEPIQGKIFARTLQFNSTSGIIS